PAVRRSDLRREERRPWCQCGPGRSAPHSYQGCQQHAPDEHVLVPLCRDALCLMAGLWWDLGSG
ncbi:MAG: hypothetical protein AAF908_10460, partial [Pseudomonadota bacterium]